MNGGTMKSSAAQKACSLILCSLLFVNPFLVSKAEANFWTDRKKNVSLPTRDIPLQVAGLPNTLSSPRQIINQLPSPVPESLIQSLPHQLTKELSSSAVA